MKTLKFIPVLLSILALSLKAQPEGGFRSYYSGIMDDSTGFQIDLTIETDRVYGTLSTDATGEVFSLEGGGPSSDGSSIKIYVLDDDDDEGTAGVINCSISPFRDTIDGTWTDTGVNRIRGLQIIKAAEYYLVYDQTDFIRAEASIPQFLKPEPAWQHLNLFLNDKNSTEAFSFVSGKEDRLVINKTNIFLGWEYRVNYLIRYYSDEFVSFLIKKDEFTVSDNPQVSYSSMNVELSENSFRNLNLPGLFIPEQNYVQALSDYIIRDLKGQRADWIISGEISRFNENDLKCFTITPKFIEFSFPPGSVAPNERGSWFVRVPYGAIAEYINPKSILNRFVKYGIDYRDIIPGKR